jgi:para-nitrobenzyl esterase
MAVAAQAAAVKAGIIHGRDSMTMLGSALCRQGVAMAAAALIGAAFFVPGVFLSGALAQSAPRIAAKAGPVEGIVKDNMAQFLGIPFAEPPVGDLRWMPPKAKASWKDVRQAKAFGPACAQTILLGAFAGPANNNEDCLYLNVFKPAKASRNLPVFVWIHGGALVDGEAAHYDVSKLVAQGLMVVTINYRLNVMGFLSHPALDAEGHPSGNYGVMDQALALQWIKDNIAAFGGNPNNVTIGGQSAGASSAAALVISPIGKGLFNRAIFQSVGASYVTLVPQNVAQARGVVFAKAANCGEGATAEVAKCLRALPIAEVQKLSGTESTFAPFITALILDGKVLPHGGITAFTSGNFNKVPILMGMVENEGLFNLAIAQYYAKDRAQPTAQAYTGAMTRAFGGNAGPGGTPPAYPAGTSEEVLKLYPVAKYETPQLAWDAATNDTLACRSRKATRLLADKVPIYAYEFRDKTAPFYFPDMPGFKPLAYHTADIQYVFPGFKGGKQGIRRELDGQQKKLSDQIVKAWANFVKGGNPNGSGDKPWPRYTAKNAGFMIQNIPAQSVQSDADYARQHNCDFWDKTLVYN